MSVDFSNVKVGDRIKLTRENGDESTFTVILDGGECVQSAANFFEGDAWDTLEILDKPLPTKHGAVVGHPSEPDWNPYILSNGVWYEAGGSTRPDPERVQYYMKEQGFKVLFEGLEYDA